MEETLVSFKVAKLAKKKGFDIGFDYYYTQYNITQESDNPSALEKGLFEGLELIKDENNR